MGDADVAHVSASDRGARIEPQKAQKEMIDLGDGILC